jgi:hypothetical protein
MVYSRSQSIRQEPIPSGMFCIFDCAKEARPRIMEVNQLTGLSSVELEERVGRRHHRQLLTRCSEKIEQ